MCVYVSSWSCRFFSDYWRAAERYVRSCLVLARDSICVSPLFSGAIGEADYLVGCSFRDCFCVFLVFCFCCFFFLWFSVLHSAELFIEEFFFFWLFLLLFLWFFIVLVFLCSVVFFFLFLWHGVGRRCLAGH